MSLEEKIAQLDEVIAIQCTDGTWNYDPYHFGLANGLLLAKAILIDEEPAFLTAPDNWLEDKKGIIPSILDIFVHLKDSLT